MASPGDYNTDGIVNAADYTIFRDTRGQTGAGLAADGNGDQVISQLDYEFWKARFGAVSPGIGTGSGTFAERAVPEPTAMAIALVAVIGFCITTLCPNVPTQTNTGTLEKPGR
jgi:hypothetical protein